MIDKLKALVKGTDIEIISVEGNEVVHLLPYDNAERLLTLYGSTDEEKIACFIELINSSLNDMIDHLGDCKLRVDQTGRFTTSQVFCG